MMNVEMQTACSCPCHGAGGSGQMTASQSQQAENFSMVFSVASVTTYFNPWSDNVHNAHTPPPEQNALQASLQNLPNIRMHMKPWYFPDAYMHNISYIRTVAIRISSKYDGENDRLYHTIFNNLQQQCGVTEKKPESGLQSVKNSQTCCDSNNPLSEQDKQTLADLHQHAQDNQLDTSHVNTVATQLAADKIAARNTQSDAPELSKDYFENVVEKLKVWTKSFDGEHAVKHLKTFFS
ncbi:MAG: hypothetical protein R3240_03390 [Gammaproteobacteria bacterium]|nr:hypothetical protein [Gammaproteobacteria bacterium]